MVERLQIKFEFNASEDRLLLRISKKEGHTSCVEYRFWLTRRFVEIFIKAIDKLIEDELAKNMQISPDTINVMKKFQHEAALSQADFSTSYDADAENCTVFGDSPLLVTTLKINKMSKGKYVFSLHNDNNLGIRLTAGMDLIHSLQKMLLDSADNAKWNKPLFQTPEVERITMATSKYIS
jgi:hypothetical protein